jgi:signal transduction histidine kinase
MDTLCRFAGGIAHDFNNLLTVINGYGRLLMAENPDLGRFREYGREIHRAGDKAAGIVEMIMAYAGRQSMHEEKFEVNAQLHRLRGFISVYLGESISLDFRPCSESGFVCGDRRLFQWALTNIIMNSKEAMPDGGRVGLGTRFIPEGGPDSADSGCGGARFEIDISDTGNGMSKDVLKRIFDPYFSTKERANVPGQGLGLACAKGIVRQFGGSIDAESAPGAGTLIRIGLPVSASRKDS